MLAMCFLPVEISDDEKIVRAIKVPYHVKNNRLKPQAFRSRQGTDDVSVMRQSYMGTNFCKAKAKEIPPANSYAGLAVILAQDIRAKSSDVYDSRDEFIGHASIRHGIVVLPDEPLESGVNFLLTERCRALCAVTSYYPDLEPLAEVWTGPTL